MKANSPRVVRPRISPLLARYFTHHEARNSARNVKPSFANIDREIRLTRAREMTFRREINAAIARLGDMSVFDKYKEHKTPKNTVKRREKVSEVTKSVDSERKIPAKRENFEEIDLKMRTFCDISPKDKSTPMHMDPQYRFPLNRRHKPSLSLSETLSNGLDEVLSQCTGLETTHICDKKAAVSSTKAALRTAHGRFERVTEMVESLKLVDQASTFQSTLKRFKAEKEINKRILESANEVKKTSLEVSEAVAKFRQKEVWRVPTLALTRHTDRLLNSLPSSLSPK